MAALEGPRDSSCLPPGRRLGSGPTLVFVSLKSILIKDRVKPARPGFLIQLLQRALAGLGRLPLPGQPLFRTADCGVGQRGWQPRGPLRSVGGQGSPFLPASASGWGPGLWGALPLPAFALVCLCACSHALCLCFS